MEKIEPNNCYNLDCNIDYFDKGTQWFNEMTKQISMFD